VNDLLLGALLAVNAVTFAAFGLDKWRAIRGRRRLPESWLLGLCAATGIVGGLIGMGVFRHKTRKASFRWKLVPVGALNVLWLWLWLGNGD